MISISLSSGSNPAVFRCASPNSFAASTSGTSSGGNLYARFPGDDFSNTSPSFCVWCGLTLPVVFRSIVPVAAITPPPTPPPAPSPPRQSSPAASSPSRTTASRSSAPDTTGSTPRRPQSSRPTTAGSTAPAPPASAEQTHGTAARHQTIASRLQLRSVSSPRMPPSPNCAQPTRESLPCRTRSERSSPSARLTPDSCRYSKSPSRVGYAARASTASAQSRDSLARPPSAPQAAPASAAGIAPWPQSLRRTVRHSSAPRQTTAPPSKQCPPPPAAAPHPAIQPRQSTQSAARPSYAQSPQSPAH